MRIRILMAVWLLAACSSPGDPASSPSPLPEGTVSIGMRSGVRTFSVEIAETPAAREQGLMSRSSMPPGSGMAFLFDSPNGSGFWMKDTLIPLSIAFWGPDGRIVDVLDMQPCETEDCPVYRPSREYVGALEVNIGALEGAEIGDTVELER